MELSESEGSLSESRCCSYPNGSMVQLPRFGLKTEVYARSGETVTDSFEIRFPSIRYMVAHIEGADSYIRIEKLYLYERTLIPSTDPDLPPHFPDEVYHEKWDMIAQADEGEQLDIPGNCKCDYRVEGTIEFAAPVTLTTFSTGGTLVIKGSSGYEKKIDLNFKVNGI